jgi:linoleoyl-CoA desaturase
MRWADSVMRCSNNRRRVIGDRTPAADVEAPDRALARRPAPPRQRKEKGMAATTAPGRMRFRGKGDFRTLLADRVEMVLADERFIRQAYRRLWAKTAVVAITVIASYLYVVVAASSVAEVVAAAVFLGVGGAGVGFVVMHDANHGGYSKSRHVNALAAHSLDLIGGSSYLWRAKHLAHHTFTNVAEHDPDIDALPFARFDPTQPRRAWHGYQHLYVWVLYAFVTIRWQFVSDFVQLRRGRVGRSPFPPPNRRQVGVLFVGKAFFVTWAIVVPLMLHPPLTVLATFLLVSAVASLALTLVFQLAHCAEETDHVDPAERAADGTYDQAWHVHQVESTVDFAQGNRVLAWYLGGLNFQIEHHLFPRLPHTVYQRLAPIVREVARDAGVRYDVHPTLRDALASHQRWLRDMGAHPPERSARTAR